MLRFLNSAVLGCAMPCRSWLSTQRASVMSAKIPRSVLSGHSGTLSSSVAQDNSVGYNEQSVHDARAQHQLREAEGEVEMSLADELFLCIILASSQHSLAEHL